MTSEEYDRILELDKPKNKIEEYRVKREEYRVKREAKEKYRRELRRISEDRLWDFDASPENCQKSEVRNHYEFVRDTGIDVFKRYHSANISTGILELIYNTIITWIATMISMATGLMYIALKLANFVMCFVSLYSIYLIYKCIQQAREYGIAITSEKDFIFAIKMIAVHMGVIFAMSLIESFFGNR